ncbi:MAG: hypothetical protein PHV35_01025 [Mariniphaga sp.]|nr:hypothetical protein [Mariniphaga sp.]
MIIAATSGLSGKMTFDSREHALNWIISNQLGRRNLNPNQIAYLRGKRYETEKIITRFKGNQYLKSGGMQNAYHQNNQPKTSQIIADEYGVNQSTIIRNAQFSRVVDRLPEEAKQDVLSGAETIRTLDASTILKFNPTTIQKRNCIILMQ